LHVDRVGSYCRQTRVLSLVLIFHCMDWVCTRRRPLKHARDGPDFLIEGLRRRLKYGGSLAVTPRRKLVGGCWNRRGWEPCHVCIHAMARWGLNWRIYVNSLVWELGLGMRRWIYLKARRRVDSGSCSAKLLKIWRRLLIEFRIWVHRG